MSIKSFIQEEVLRLRLNKNEVLVVYDPEQRYRELCLAMQSEDTIVVDASASSILSREAALSALQRLGDIQNSLKYLLVYVPQSISETDEAKQHDPFSLYAVCGAVFPQGDGDSLQSLCIKAKPDHLTEIRQLFTDNPQPDFAQIDAIGGGISWPILRATLGVESAQEILMAFMAPNIKQKERLESENTWFNEIRSLLSSSIGLTLHTHSPKWDKIAAELWRYILFSEFVYDLPEALPETLRQVPHASESAQTLIESLCLNLRSHLHSRSLYIDQAEAIETELDLAGVCEHLKDLGQRDTFPFEERMFFYQALEALENKQLNTVQEIIGRHRDSVWAGRGESQTQWDFLQAALNFLAECEQQSSQIQNSGRSLPALFQLYTDSLYRIDTLYREFEQNVYTDIELEQKFAELIHRVRKSYTQILDKMQTLFIKHLENEGWPLSQTLSNAHVFDKLITTKLKQSGYRVAILLVDALRYELGVELHKILKETEPAELIPACASLPSITQVGMASLLPQAGTQLEFKNQNDKFIPVIGEHKLENLSHRMDYLRKLYGQRFQEMTLEDFYLLKGPKPKKQPKSAKVEPYKKMIPEETELLVLRSTEIDSLLESHPTKTLDQISETLKLIRVALAKIKSEGFNEAVIVSDHGFVLNTHADHGDVAPKPEGKWVALHNRILLGSGHSDAHNLLVPAIHLGIKGDYTQAALPRSLAAYRKGYQYFHGGASLQELAVPVITISFREATPKYQKFEVRLSYKNGAQRITTLRPVIDIELIPENIFAGQQEQVELLLEAHAKVNGKKQTVGEAKPGGAVNSVTGTLSLQPRTKIQVAIMMERDFEGEFEIKALDPSTFKEYASLKLKTNYLDI